LYALAYDPSHSIICFQAAWEQGYDWEGPAVLVSAW